MGHTHMFNHFGLRCLERGKYLVRFTFPSLTKWSLKPWGLTSLAKGLTAGFFFMLSKDKCFIRHSTWSKQRGSRRNAVQKFYWRIKQQILDFSQGAQMILSMEQILNLLFFAPGAREKCRNETLGCIITPSSVSCTSRKSQT